MPLELVTLFLVRILIGSEKCYISIFVIYGQTDIIDGFSLKLFKVWFKAKEEAKIIQEICEDKSKKSHKMSKLAKR